MEDTPLFDNDEISSKRYLCRRQSVCNYMKKSLARRGSVDENLGFLYIRHRSKKQVVRKTKSTDSMVYYFCVFCFY